MDKSSDRMDKSSDRRNTPNTIRNTPNAIRKRIRKLRAEIAYEKLVAGLLEQERVLRESLYDLLLKK